MRPEEAHVLVIEDDPNNMLVIQELLRLLGIKHIVTGPSGWQGLRLAREEMPKVDLVLLDIQLPSEDGYAVLERIRQSPRFQETRVVAVTANVLPQDEARARAAGFDGFIGKPLDFDLFPRQILDLLEGRQVWRPR